MMKTRLSYALFRKLTRGVVFLLLLAIIPACQNQSSSNFEFQVLVNNSQGYKVANARVLLTHAGGTDSRLTDDNGKVSFFLERQYLGNLATVQIQADGFMPYKSELKLSSSPQEVQIEQVAGDPQKPDGGKSMNTQNASGDTVMKPPVPTPAPVPLKPKYPLLQANISVSGKLAENAQACYSFSGTANTPLLFTFQQSGFYYRWGFFDAQERELKNGSGGREQKLPFTPQQDGLYAICFKASDGFGPYVLVYEVYK